MYILVEQWVRKPGRSNIPKIKISINIQHSTIYWNIFHTGKVLTFNASKNSTIPENELLNLKQKLHFHQDENLRLSHELSNSQKKYKLIKEQLNEIENEMLKNFYKDSKKVDNKKMKEFFSLKLKYPTYVEGLNYIFNNNI